MKNLKLLSLVLVLSLIGVTVAGCSKKTVAPTTTTQDITVGKGNITVSITSTGSMDYANYQNLSFATDGNVGAVNVKVGDIVKKDQVLATLDETSWNNSLTSLTQAVQTAQRNLTTVQSNLAKAQRAVTTAQLTVSQDALTAQNDQNVVQKDQNTLQKDQDALGNISDVQTAQNAVDAAQSALDAAQSNWQITSAQGDAATADLLFKLINGDPSIKDSFGVYIPNGLKVQLAQAQKNLKSVENGTSTTVTSDVALQVATAQVQISADQLQIQKDQLQILKDGNTAIGDQAAIDDANTAVANAQQDVTNAQTTLTTAQTNLTTAQAASTQITAPFDGAISAVNIQAGVGLSVSSLGAIKAGATAIVIADTSKFVANMMINETDLANINIGTMATVTASAIPNQTLSAVVKTVSPIATVQSGVVNYAVTATIMGVAPQARTTTGTTGQSGATTTPSTSGQSGTAITPTTSGQTGPFGFQSTSGEFGPNGTPPTDLPSGATGQANNLTPDQIAQIQQQIQQRQAARQQSSVFAMSQLRQGMSLTVNLIEQQAQNVIVVPNNAIKTVSGKYYVQLKTSSGTPQQQEVTTGIKDYSNTQILTGLNVGDVIIITKTATTAKTTTTTTTGGAGLFGGGGGGGRAIIP